MPPQAAFRVAGQSYRQPAGQETRSSLRQPAGQDPPASDPDPLSLSRSRSRSASTRSSDPDPPATSTSQLVKILDPAIQIQRSRSRSAASWSRSRSSLRQPAGQDPPPAGHVFRLGSLDYRVKKRQPKTKNHQFFIMASGLTNVS